MQRYPCPILIAKAKVGPNSGKVFQAMGYGALDVVRFSVMATQPAESGKNVGQKISVIDRLQGRSPASAQGAGSLRSSSMRLALQSFVAIGSSTGGPTTLTSILNQIPSQAASAFVAVQQIEAHFAPALISWLNGPIAMPVVQAKAGQQPQAGRVYRSVTNHQMVID